ncbi:MAG: hypothetical protein NZM26_05055 [Patescibacteria group bacterium]|nr:hypothetical protein [Patescibacteria group bacterium]
MLAVKNDVGTFLKENKLDLFKLLIVLAKKHGQKVDEFFPVNRLSSVYYAIVYTVLDEDLALMALGQIKTAFNWIDGIDVAIEGGNFDENTFRNHEAKLKLEKEVPTSFLKSVLERVVSQSVPMLISQTKLYQYKIANNLPFTEEEIVNYLRIKSADSYIYGAILEGMIPDYISILQSPLSKLWQINNLVDDFIDYDDDKKDNQPNALSMIENLHGRQESVFDYAKAFLARQKEELVKFDLPKEIIYLADMPNIIERVGIKVLSSRFGN